MAIYVEQYGGFWKITAAEWAKVIALALIGTSVDYDSHGWHLRRRPKIIAKTETGETFIATNDHRLVKPDDWSESDWLNEAYEVGALKHRDHRAMIEATSISYRSTDGYRLKREPHDWTLRNADGKVVDTSQYINDITDRNKIELLEWSVS